MASEYRFEKSKFKYSQEEIGSALLFGRTLINSASYIWHPSLLYVTLDAEINPGYRHDAFLTVPDRSETRRYERVGLDMQLFRYRPFSVGGFWKYGRGTFLRDSFSDVSERRKNLGAYLDSRNRTLPIQAKYEWIQWRQHEVLFGRTSFDSRHNTRITANKEFGQSSKHSAIFEYDDFTRKISSITNNRNTRLDFRNNFGVGRNTRVNSTVAFNNQVGSHTYSRIRVDEKLRVVLPKSLHLTGSYRFMDTGTRAGHSKLNRFSVMLEHQLYESLTSRVRMEYSDVREAFFSESIAIAGIGVNYRKRIPTGRIFLSYDFQKRSNNRTSEIGLVPVIGEEKLLEDGRLTLLEYPNAIQTSVVVTDFDRTFTYEENFDYLVIDRGSRLELQRIQGGQIKNGALVLVDYLSERGSASFDTPQTRLSARVILLDSRIEFYVNAQELRFENIRGAPGRLRSVSQRVFGTIVRLGRLTVGAEVDDFDSSVVPYRTTRFNIEYSTRVGRRTSIGIGGNLRNVLLKQTHEEQLYARIGGRVAYFLTRSSSLYVDWYYRYQDGRGLDLRLTDVRVELEMRMRKLFLTVGSQIFLRNFIGEQRDIMRGYLTLSRRF